MSDPLAVFNQAVAAVERGAWEEAAALCDPGSLSMFRRELLARLSSPPAPWTVEQLLQSAPEMPRAVAEYQVARFNEHRGVERILEQDLPSMNSVDEVRALSPAQVFAAWLEGQSAERQVERSVRDGHSSLAALDFVREHPLRTAYHVLGVIAEGDRLAHVVYRWDFIDSSTDEDDEQVEPEEPDDLTPEEVAFMRDYQRRTPHISALRRQDDGSWRLVAEHRFLGRHNGFYAVVDGGR